MPISPPLNGFAASQGARTAGVGNSTQGPTLYNHRAGSLDPTATDFSPTPTASTAEDISRGQIQAPDPPMTMKELTHDMAILTDEVLRLRREKTAIEEALKKVSWTVTFRPIVEPSGNVKAQILDAPMSFSAMPATEHHDQNLVLKDGPAEKQDNEPKQSIGDSSRYKVGWMPLVVRGFAPLNADKTSVIPDASNMVTFSFEFLQHVLGGKEYNPGFYYAPPSKGDNEQPSQTWYALDDRFDPYLPKMPGAHGAKLTVFYNEECDEDDQEGPTYNDVPVFVRASKWLNAENDNLFVYYGSYTQSRWSDKLDYDRMIEAVPDGVKMYWADLLTSPARPQWLTDAIMKHFWPPPQYEDPLSSDDTESDKVARKRMEKFAKNFQGWKKDATMKVKMLKKENILKAFKAADADEEPGLRFFWEYLECVDWDAGFYAALVKHKNKPGTI